jgi:exopolysaccharide biosynthesis polyprenyl glycosylphosphotransferase
VSAVGISLEAKAQPDAASTGTRHSTVEPVVITQNRRTALQQRAPGTIRRHAERAALRFLVLVSGDLIAFVTVRAVLRAVRDGTLLGAGPARAVTELFPVGFLGGWQFAAALLVGLAVAGAYRPGDHRRDVQRVLLGVAFAAGLALWSRFWAAGLAPVALQFAATVVLMGAAVFLVRRLIDVGVMRFGSAVLPKERILIVGDPEQSPARDVTHRLLTVDRMELVGWVGAAGGHDEQGADRRRLGDVSEIWDVLHQVDVDTVVLCDPIVGERFDVLVEAVATAGLRLVAPSRYEGVGWLRPTPVKYYRAPYVELTVPALRGHHLFLKRLADVLGAGIGLVLTAPLFLVLTALVKRDSPGPVFFSQERVGYGGRTFRMLKFRTMRDGADEEKDTVAHLNHSGDGRLFKIPDDPRVTRIGVWLRRWSLDELPQLWNVFKGEMSLVGPRPFFERDLAAYSDHHFVRLGAKPGITGWWQVKGRSSVVDFEEVVRLDREYIERWSAWLDVKILLATVPAVVRRTGAY